MDTETGLTHATKHYTEVWCICINKLTVRRLKMEYLKKLEKEILKQKNCVLKILLLLEPIACYVSQHSKLKISRPLLLGEELDATVQVKLVQLQWYVQ